ncbi:hypothetical protein E2C01_075825 [Portunus trituberculatus]|uniref:Uncharacterized protein n=1 Tax=Portunus trituberculatus TaxID=210409 RepID=A0A5B7IK64_PORTR|nr:hypothetical protein [Portunus trituberculatus]
MEAILWQEVALRLLKNLQ